MKFFILRRRLIGICVLGGCKNLEITHEKEFCDLQNTLQMLFHFNLSQQPVKVIGILTKIMTVEVLL